MIERDLLEYIRTEIAYDRTEELRADDKLLDGVLDSLGILRLVSYVEEKYPVTIQDGDLLPENFASAQALAELLRSKGVT